jgi:hypothetical protein
MSFLGLPNFDAFFPLIFVGAYSGDCAKMNGSVPWQPIPPWHLQIQQHGAHNPTTNLVQKKKNREWKNPSIWATWAALQFKDFVFEGELLNGAVNEPT